MPYTGVQVVVLIKRSCPAQGLTGNLSPPLPRKLTLTARPGPPPPLGFPLELLVEVYGAPKR